MAAQNSSKTSVAAARSLNAKTNGTFALSALELKKGDTLVLAQLGDPCLPKDALEKLPDGIEVIDLDFLEFSWSQRSETPHEWETDPNWPCKYLETGIRKTFRDFANNLTEFVKKPSGTVKCFFDVSDYPLGTLEPICPYAKKKRTARYSERLAEHSISNWNWGAIDDFATELARSADPALMNCAPTWGPLLYVALANLICGDGLSATILPEAYLKDSHYIPARNEFVRNGLIRSVVYLGPTHAAQEYPALLLTSKIRNTGNILCAYAPVSEKSQKTIQESLRLESMDAVPSIAAQAFLHEPWGKEEAAVLGLNLNWRFEFNLQLLFQNEARLDSKISDFYESYRGYEAKLRDMADRVQSYSPRIGKQAIGKNLPGEPTEAERENGEQDLFRYTFFPQSPDSLSRDVLTEKMLPEEHCLIPGDILISRIVRTADERDASRTSYPKITFVYEESLKGGKCLCPTSYICIRPKADFSLYYSLALVNYLANGHGKWVLNAIVKMQNGSLTWDVLKNIELPPALVYGSDDWHELETQIKENADDFLDAHKKFTEAYERNISSQRRLIDEFLEAFK